MIIRPVRVTPGSDLTVWQRVRLGAEILVTYVRARRRMRARTLEQTLAELRALPRDGQAPADRQALGLRLGRTTVRALETLPSDSRCLIRSLVLTGLLVRRGVDTKLVLAVRPGESFAAHAWVELDGAPLLEPAGEPFRRLVEL